MTIETPGRRRIKLCQDCGEQWERITTVYVPSHPMSAAPCQECGEVASRYVFIDEKVAEFSAGVST